MRKKLVYIAQYFDPEPYLKDSIFISDLKDKGWDPIVITAFPNYPKGNIYPGYQNRFFSVEEIKGIKVVRVLTFAYHGLSTFKRTLNYLVFGIFSAFALIKYGKSKSIYYILQSSPFMVFCAWTIRIFKPGSKILLDIQDVFPENIRISGFIKSNWIINVLDFFLNNFYYSSFDFFVVVSNSFRNLFINNKKMPAEKIKTVFNWSMIENNGLAKENEAVFHFDDAYFNVVYAGNIGVHQGLSKLADAFNQIPQLFPKIKIHFFGDGTDFEPLVTATKANENLVFHGRVASSEIGKYLEAADVLFLHLVKDPVYLSIIPSKLQAYIEVGKPILGGIEGEASAIVLDHQLGETFGSENGAALLNALARIANYNEHEVAAILERSKTLYEQEFSRKAGVNKINDFLLMANEY